VKTAEERRDVDLSTGTEDQPDQLWSSLQEISEWGFDGRTAMHGYSQSSKRSTA